MECVSFVWIFTVFGFIKIQAGADEISHTGLTSFEQLDRNVVDSVLKTVDSKFDSLSERISSLERAVNGLQYYNVRQFKTVNTNMNSFNQLLQSLNAKLVHFKVKVDNTGIENSITDVKQDLKTTQKATNMMFEAMEQNFNYLNKDFSEKLNTLESMVSVINQSSDEMSRKIKESLMSQPLTAPVTNQPNCSEMFEKFDDKVNVVINNTISSLKFIDQAAQSQASVEQIQKLAVTLESLNENVKRTMSYYHHTGDLVERIVGATETVAEDQTLIRDDLREFLEKQTNITQCSGQRNSEILPAGGSPPQKVAEHCRIPAKAMTDFKHVLENGTHLVEIVTALAETSQKSLKTTVVELLKEVYRLKDVQKSEPKTTNPPTLNGFIEYDFELLLNATKGVLQMIEAVASNTRWIPYIFHNLQFVEGQINHTLSNSYKYLYTLELLDQSRTTSLQGGSSNNASFSFILGTLSKLNRIMPSLTQLLGEPEPFIVLNGGRRENEGRVEIYRKGKWGTLCGNFGHIEAAYICRHLGYMGGNSAGSGFFGPGSGIFWKVNVSCLYSRQCDIVKPMIQADHCDHQHDFAVICDHMVRLVSDDESKSRTTGFLEIHHMEHWTRICSDNWTDENSNVACRQLGYTSGSVSSPSGEYKPPPEELPAVLNNVTCTGNEIRLDACSYSSWSPKLCPSKEFVHLSCS